MTATVVRSVRGSRMSTLGGLHDCASNNLRAYKEYIGYYQTGDVPARKEPDTVPACSEPSA